MRGTRLSLTILLVFTMLLALAVGCEEAVEEVEEPEEEVEEVEEEVADPEEEEPESYTLRWGSAGPGTGANVTVEAMAQVVNAAEPKINIAPQATAGSVENMRLLEQGEIDLGIAQGDVAREAYEGLGDFDGNDEMLALFSPYWNHQFFVTREGTGIDEHADLEGRDVNLGPPGSGAAAAAETLLSALDVTVNENFLSYADGARALADGTVDATIVLGIGNRPSDALLELDATIDDMVILELSEDELDELHEIHPVALRNPMEAEHLTNIDEDVYTMSHDLVHYTDRRMSEEAAYLLIKNIFDNYEDLAVYHDLAELITPDTALMTFGGIPFHPGAVRYYQEEGLWNEDLMIGELD